MRGYEIRECKSDSGPASKTSVGATAPSIAFKVGVVPWGIPLLSSAQIKKMDAASNVLSQGQEEQVQVRLTVNVSKILEDP
jgi:hypothetical protein